MGSNALVKDYQILKKPIVSEKTSLIGSAGRVVAFKVPQSASKLDIKGAVERIFDVQVQQVRTINVMGKLKRTVAGAGRQSKYKKAYVTLAEGHTVDVISGV